MEEKQFREPGCRLPGSRMIERESNTKLTFGELKTTACAFAAVFFPFLHARITGKHPVTA
jgi:hypothetical protein